MAFDLFGCVFMVVFNAIGMFFVGRVWVFQFLNCVGVLCDCSLLDVYKYTLVFGLR